MESFELANLSVSCTDTRSSVFALIALARPWQWSKNALVFAPLIFGRRLFRLHDLTFAMLAFAAFCALSSFAYALNDICDRDADRRNPEKQQRPLARGELKVAQAAAAAAILGVFGLSFSLVLGLNFAIISTLYIALQVGYSLRLRRYVVLDVVVVALGFVLRAFGGGVAIGVAVSPWLAFMAFMLAMLLVLGRRRHELAIMGVGAAAHRTALAKYSPRLLDQMIAMVAAATLVGYMIYTASAEAETNAGAGYLYATAPLVAFGILRYLYLVDERNEGGDPTQLLTRDSPLLLTVCLWLVTVIGVLYA